MYVYYTDEQVHASSCAVCVLHTIITMSHESMICLAQQTILNRSIIEMKKLNMVSVIAMIMGIYVGNDNCSHTRGGSSEEYTLLSNSSTPMVVTCDISSCNDNRNDTNNRDVDKDDNNKGTENGIHHDSEDNDVVDDDDDDDKDCITME